MNNTSSRSSRRGTTEAPWIRWTLTGLALVFIALFLVLPLAAVFTEALRKGWLAYWEAQRWQLDAKRQSRRPRSRVAASSGQPRLL